MIPLNIFTSDKLLIIAPHPDDEVIGVGGTIVKRALAGDEVYVCVVTKGCMPLFSPVQGLFLLNQSRSTEWL